MLHRLMYNRGLTVFVTVWDFMVPLSEGKLDFYPVILNGFVICFLCAELERQSYFLPYKHPEQIKKQGNVR